MEVFDITETEETKTKSKVSNQSYWLRSFMSTASSFQRTRRSISKSTRRFCSVYFAKWTWRDESCGRTNRGYFTVTMHSLTISPWISASFWLRGTSLDWNPTIAPWDCFFPQAQGALQGDSAWKHGSHQKGYSDGTEGVSLKNCSSRE